LIFIDTSVWVAGFRDARSAEARHLSAILDADEAALSAPVFLEILSGASRLQRTRLRTTLTALPLFYPTLETWRRIENWIETAGDSGEHFGIADLLIGAIAAEHEATLWSLDEDFARMARLNLLTLYQPTDSA